MPSVRDRALSILDLLARHPPELPLADIADRLDIPRGAAHRVLADLKETGYVRQDREGGPYRLTAKIVTLAFAYLVGNGIPDVAQPVLDRLAEATGELVRLAVVDGGQLTWVAKAQGKQHGLRVDPDDGAEVYLPATANGQAWLSCMDDDAALEVMARQGFRRDGYGPGAPRSLQDLLAALQRARTNGFATVVDAYEAGTSAVAVPIRRNGGVIGTVSVAGPTVRLTADRMDQIASILREGAAELGLLAAGSPLFASARSLAKR